jgi:hypothetical protein
MATSTVQTVGEIPEVLEPFYTTAETGLIPRGVAEIFQPYEQRYAPLIDAGLVGAGTVAPMSQAQQAVGQRLETMGLPAAFTQAQQAGQTAMGAYQGIPGVAAPELTQFQLGAPTQAEINQYMSPYLQAVVDIQQRKAIDAAKQAQLSQNLGAARQGTYGGARQAILEGQREAGLRTQLGDIQAQGLQSAYEQAQNLRQRTAEQNLAAALGVQQLGAGQSLEAQRANQAAQLQGAAGLTGLAQTMGGLGTQQLAGELDITKTLGAYGDLQRALAQQQMDAERGYLEQQAQYGLSQVGDLSNLLRGIPLSNTTQTTSTPPPSFASQLTGLGMTGIGLYNLLGGGK